jgi:farnesyl-diphosphate farnesyltransferase
MAEPSRQLLRQLLKEVSRSFYLTLRVLPKSIRPQIGLAYLLARTTDTIADTELVSMEQRLRTLRALRERILGSSTGPIDFGDLVRQQGSPEERALLEKCEASLALLRSLSPADQQLIRSVLETITSGQELDLRRFAGASAGRIVALPTDGDLEDYTYRVAGCVGEFWTRICRAHVFRKTALEDSFLLPRAIQFGKGLQMVNILRDLPADLRKGRCYLPNDRLMAVGLNPGDLLESANEARFRPLFGEYLDRAQLDLAAGWDYTNALPWRHGRVRLACAWPILIGVKTIERLRVSNVLNPEQRVKISRREVRQLVGETFFLYFWPPLWRKLYPGHLGKAVASRALFS